MKKILFRADAKPSIGTGDLMSLIHLSKYFKKNSWEPHFIIRNYKAGVSIVKKHKLNKVFVIDENFSVQQEMDIINSYIEKHCIDAIFFEITENNLSEYKGLSENVFKGCAVFDGAVPDDMDLVVSWDVVSDKFFDKAKYPKTTFFLGPEYVILPVEFDTEKIKNRQYNTNPETLLVAMGGADELNFTQKVVDALIRNGIDLKINVIIGSGYEYKEKLKKNLENSSLKYEIKHNVIDMFREYMQCDIAIGGGGLTSSELVATRTPAILIALYEPQISRCEYFARHGLAQYLGYREVNSNLLLNYLKKINLPNNEMVFHGKEKIFEFVNSY